MIKTEDYYRELGLTREASHGEIKSAFYGLLKQSPPEQKPQEYQRLREAYDVLSNPVSRREYDSMLEFGDEISQLKERAQAAMQAEPPDYELAMSLLKKAVVLGPEIGLLRDSLGHCYLELKDPSNALTQFQRAIAIDPANPQYKLHRGRAEEENGQISSAMSTYRQLIAENPDDYAPSRALASLLFSNDQAEEAHRVLDRAISADGQTDFMDFFCIYDKLHYYLLKRDDNALKSHLGTIISIAREPADKQFASFMLRQTGFQLYEVGAFALSSQFVSAAARLVPEDTDLRSLAMSSDRWARVEIAMRELDALPENSIDKVVKFLVTLNAGAFLGQIEEEDFRRNRTELGQVITEYLSVDPLSAGLKSSVRLVKTRFRVLYDIEPDLYDTLLSAPEPLHALLTCPYCDRKIRVEKWELPISGACPHCSTHVNLSLPGIKRLDSGRVERSASTSPSSSSGDCFVATAVYGDANHPDVRVIRDFRDQSIRSWLIGAHIIRVYDTVGPVLASFVSRHATIKLIIRETLVTFAKVLRRLRY